jgi:opacity protein-like surface antigen
MDFEVLALPDFKVDDINLGGRGIGFLTNFVMEFPSDARWLTPYVQGGGGVMNIRVEPDVRILADDDRVTPFRNFLRGRFPNIPNLPNFDGDRLTQLISYSETSLALSVGGGVDFRVWENLSVGPNITFTKLFGNFRDLELTRIGARASYRF